MDQDETNARLNAILLDHEDRIKFLEDLAARIVSLNETVVQLLTRNQGEDEENGRS